MQVSFHPADHTTLLVTGFGCYKYMRIADNQMKVVHAAIPKKEPQISQNYTCHLWLPTG
jgi:hypothetical protein